MYFYQSHGTFSKADISNLGHAGLCLPGGREPPSLQAVATPYYHRRGPTGDPASPRSAGAQLASWAIPIRH